MALLVSLLALCFVSVAFAQTDCESYADTFVTPPSSAVLSATNAAYASAWVVVFGRPATPGEKFEFQYPKMIGKLAMP